MPWVSRTRRAIASVNNQAPEPGRMPEELKADQHLAFLRSDQPGHPAGEVFIGLRVCQDKRLRTRNIRGNGHQSAVFAHVDGLGNFMEGLVSVPAVKQDGNRG